jgi:RNA polymerase sigma factor (sigma-70 family)
MPPAVRDPVLLLAHAAWLRRLAHRLVGDGAVADELVQDTWVAALRRPPAADRPMRPWLRHVLKNMARLRWRGDAHRAAREQAVAARDDATPSSHELIERHETQLVLARLVTELDEPFRTTILLCYAEGLAPSEIARRLGIPAGTIRWRLKEGLDRLRGRLDALHDGDRRAWMLALTPLLEGGVMAPATKLSPMLLLLLLLASLATVWLAVRPGAATVAPLSGARTAAVRGSTAPALDVLAGLARGTPPGWLAQEAAPPRRVAGRVLADGAPVAGALVRLTSELSLTGLVAAREQRSDARGGFDFGAQIARPLTVSAAVPGRLAAIEHVDLRDPTARPAADALELVLEPCLAALYGKVVDAAGTPIVHAQLLREDAIGTETDATGSYELCLRPLAVAAAQLRLVVRADGYGSIMLDVGVPGRVRHDFTLSPEATITGRARGPDGAPVAYAKIWLERADTALRRETEQSARLITATDSDGRFRFAGVAGGRHRIGGGGAGLTATRVAVTVVAGGTGEVALAMIAAGTLRGRVVRAGRPVAGARIGTRDGESDGAVSQADGTFVLDRVPAGHVQLTASPYRVRSPDDVVVAAGARGDVVLEVEPLAVLRGVVRHHGTPAARARVCAWLRDHGPTSCVNADAQARFELPELAAGDYSLFADDPELGAAVHDVQLALGEGEQKTLDLALTGGERIAGTVVDPAGAPVAGARVRFTCAASRDESQCITGAHGEFTCRAMAGACAYDTEVFAGPDTSVALRFVGASPSPVTLASGQRQITELRLVVDSERRAIRGLVVDATGAPIGDARVRVWGDQLDPDWPSPTPSAVTGLDGRFRLADLAPGRYTLEVVTSDAVRRVQRGVAAGSDDLTVIVDAALCANTRLAGAGDPLRAAIVHVEPAEIASRPRGAVIWGGQLQLLGWNVPRAVVLGQPVEITLYYKVLQPIDRDWTIYLHFSGASWHNADHEPVDGRCSTSTWQPGDVIVDRFTTTLGADNRAPGNYDLTIGLFNGWAPSWHNMPVSAAPAELRAKGDGVKIATLTATAP